MGIYQVDLTATIEVEADNEEQVRETVNELIDSREIEPCIDTVREVK